MNKILEMNQTPGKYLAEKEISSLLEFIPAK